MNKYYAIQKWMCSELCTYKHFNIVKLEWKDCGNSLSRTKSKYFC